MEQPRRSAYLSICATADNLGEESPTPDLYGLDPETNPDEMGGHLRDVSLALRPGYAWFLVMKDGTPETTKYLYHTDLEHGHLTSQQEEALFFPTEEAANDHRNAHGLTDTMVVHLGVVVDE